MKYFVRIFFLLCFSYGACAFADTSKASPQMLEKLLSRFQSFQADVSEKMVVQGQTQYSSGSVAIERPNKFRWVTNTPHPELFVSDGKQLWQYEVDLSQVTVRGIDSHTATYSPLMLLSGEVKDLYSLYFIKPIDEHTFLLIPKDKGNLILSIQLTFNNSGVLTAMDLKNSLGQMTYITFSKVVLNGKIDPAQFQFTPPASADVLRG